MVATILGAIAEWELDRIRGNWRGARSSAVERGVFVGGTVPLGYRKDVGEDGKGSGRLTPNRDGRIVRQLFEKRVAGESWSHLAEWLANNTGRPWSVGAVRHLIANRTYLGEIHGGQGLVNAKAHKPITDRATFEAANAVKGVVPARSGNASGLLSGVLRCAACRYAMKPSMNKSRHGKPFLEYRCKGGRRENASRCPSPASISARVIEPFVVAAFFDGIGEYRASRLGDEEAVEHARQHLVDAEAERDAALDTRLQDALAGDNSDAYVRLVRARQRAVDKATAALAEAQGASIELPDVDFAELWPDLSMQDQRRLLASALEAVFIRRGVEVDERTFIAWRGDGIELPVRGRRWTPRPFEFPAPA